MPVVKSAMGIHQEDYMLLHEQFSGVSARVPLDKMSLSRNLIEQIRGTNAEVVLSKQAMPREGGW